MFMAPNRTLMMAPFLTPDRAIESESRFSRPRKLCHRQGQPSQTIKVLENWTNAECIDSFHA